jgi:hypothetical protein
MGYGISQFSSEKDAEAQRHAMMITVACGTARRLGYTWTHNADGSIDVTMGEAVHVAEDWSTFTRWMREDWKARKVAT